MNLYDESKNLIVKINESSQINNGGEGKIIDAGNNKVAKIYFPNRKPLSKQKFNELSSLDNSMFIKPEQLCYDNKGSLVGFIMKKISSDFFPFLPLCDKNFCQRENISDKLKLSIINKIIEGVKYAHSKNVIIGDLNPYNLLINTKGDVYFIDVDSYETPSFKHSGVQLDEIRDHLYNGDISKESDYFALALMVFNAITFVHPFKGVYRANPSLSNRMIKKESIISNLTGLIIPKCYKPITNNDILNQFKLIFNDGKRFLISLDTNKIITNNSINIKPIAKNDNIKVSNGLSAHLVINDLSDAKTYCSKNRLIVVKANSISIYDLSIKGQCTFLKEIKGFNTVDKEFFVCDNNIFYAYNNFIYNLESNKKIFDFKTLDSIKYRQYDNILVAVTKENIYKLFLDRSLLDNIYYEVIECFGDSFHNINGLFQTIDNASIVFYNKNNLNSSLVRTKISDIIEDNDCGIVEYVKDNIIKYNLFRIKNLQFEFFDDNKINELHHITSLNENIMVIPFDDKLIFYRKEDMMPVLEFDCNIISNETILHSSNAGIVAINDDSIYILNKN